MAESYTGGLGPPIIDGKVLDLFPVKEQDFTVHKIKSVTPLAGGGQREAFVWQGAGWPLVREKRELTLHYEHLGRLLDLVEELLAVPGPHDVIVWKRLHPVYVGDGVRTVFYLPWRSALDFYSIPGPLTSGGGQLGKEVRVGIDGSPLTVSTKDAGAYAGTPGGSEAWFLDQGSELKLGTAPGDGALLYVRVVPILKMFEAPDNQVKYPAGQIVEPRDIVLVEQ